MKIDSHHHFWKYDPLEYAWMDASMVDIQRDFLPCHLQREIADTAVNGVVTVQARQTVDETQWLLDLANENDFIKGVVGWVDLVSPRLGVELERFGAHTMLKSVRHVVHDEADDNFILRDDFNRGIRELKKHSLAYDILIFERHLPQTIRFVDAHPDQVFVLDHIAKPRIREALFEPWNTYIRELARRPNVYCKVSGMVTEANHSRWTEAQLRPYFDAVLDAFGPSGWVQAFATDEAARVLGGTAIDAYRLK